MSDNNRHEVIIGGTGGQGVITIGYVLAAAASEVRKYVTRFPIYLAMQRGGAAYCTVIFSDDKIASPILSASQSIIAMEDGSYARFKNSVRKGGKLVVNSSVVNKIDDGDGFKACPVPVIDMAQEMGNKKMANMVMLGAYCEITKPLEENIIIGAIEKILAGEGREDRLKANLDAYYKGVEYARENKL